MAWDWSCNSPVEIAVMQLLVVSTIAVLSGRGGIGRNFGGGKTAQTNASYGNIHGGTGNVCSGNYGLGPPAPSTSFSLRDGS
ncbi:unnamed protein product, partial [Ilex paraguariensis]